MTIETEATGEKATAKADSPTEAKDAPADAKPSRAGEAESPFAASPAEGEETPGGAMAAADVSAQAAPMTEAPDESAAHSVGAGPSISAVPTETTSQAAAEKIEPAPPSESPAGQGPDAAATRAPSAAAPPVVPEARSAAAPESTSLFRRRATLQGAKQTLQPQAPPAPPPKKRKRRNGALSAASGFLSFLLVAFVAGAFAIIAVMHKLKEPGPLNSEKVVYLPPRSDVPEMLSQLEREGVIDSPGLMNFAVLVEGVRGKLKPGEYLFKKGISLRDVIEQMVAGRQLLHSVTIPEGLTTEQIIQRLRDVDILVGEISEAPKEGALLPETYKFPRGFPRARLIAKMQEDQRKLVESIWMKRAKDLPLRTPFELVTLASIVEKETGKAEERPHVAAVFLNRLRKGMRLQSDPTIVYGLVGGKASLGRGIMRSEIEKWTPYNTYVIDGLPPGPIANPGRAALEAAANPANTRDLYFVADGNGGHVFSETLDQHSRNVQQWRKFESDRKDKSGVEADRAAPAAVPPATPKSDKRTQAPIGRLVDAAGHEDYPPGKAVAEDDGPTHRLGKFGPAGAAFFLGGHPDPSAGADSALVALRPARPFFTEALAQPRLRSAFDPALLAAGAGPIGQEQDGGSVDGDLGLDMARESADGRALLDEGSDIAAYPVSPARRAEQKARAAKLGLSAGSDELPNDAVGEKLAPAEPAAAALGPAPTLERPARARAFDASEGTALDPLRDKSWDLTSPKTVPAAASFR